ncbi:MAG TPA: hemerythrin domain-containing protein [Byssovorax sp.]|jgi:hemerythrin-like domain-containing protein
MIGIERVGVLRTAVFRRQHEELAQSVADITALLDAAELAKDASIVSGHLSILSGKLTVHLAMEDKGLYPRLARHASRPVRDLAQRFMSEMGSIHDVFRDYLARWRDPAQIQRQAQSFVEETKGLLAALTQRIAREDNELYPMVDREG